MLLHNRNIHMEILQILMCVFYLLCSVRLYELHVTIYSGDDLCILSTKGGYDMLHYSQAVQHTLNISGKFLYK